MTVKNSVLSLRNGILMIMIFFAATAWSQDDTSTGELLQLKDCISIALKGNSNLIQAGNTDEIAKMDVVSSYQGILPTISVTARRGKVETGPSEYLSNEPVGIDPETGNVIYEQRTRKIERSFRESSSASITASQSIFDGGIWWNQIRKSRTDKKSSEYNLMGEINNVIYLVQQAYFDYIKQIKLMEVYDMAVKRSEAQLDRTEKMYELGAIARLDVFQAKVNLGNDRINYLNQKNTVIKARKDLNLVMGRDPLTPLQVKADIQLKQTMPDVDLLIADAFESQPLVKKAAADIRSSELSVSMAKGVNYPRVSIYLNYDRFHESSIKVFSDYDQNYQVSYGINVSMNIFNGFNDYANVQKAQINHRNAMEGFEQYKRDLKSEVHQTYSNYQSMMDIIEINQQNLEAANEEVRLAEERYQIGAGTSLEVREAQVNLTRAEETLIAAQFNARLLLAQMDNQLGLAYQKVTEFKE